jgi:hypothetical protein
MRITFFTTSLLFFFFLFGGSLSAQVFPDTLKTNDDCKMVADSIAQLFHEKKTNEAKMLLQKYWQLDLAELEKVWSQSAEQQIPFINSNQYGDGIPGHSPQLKKTKESKKLLLSYMYVVRYEKHFLRIQVTFYKPTKASDWGISGFQCDDLSDLLFPDE